MNKKIKKIASITVIASLLMSQVVVASPKKVHFKKDNQNYSFDYTRIGANPKLFTFFRKAFIDALRANMVIYVEDAEANKTIKLTIDKPYYDSIQTAPDEVLNVPTPDVIVTADANGEVVETPVVVAVDKNALITAITEANTNKTTFTSGGVTKPLIITTSSGLEVSNTDMWVTEADVATYETAIGIANAVKDKADVTQAEVDAAIATLAEATTAFTDAKKPGEKVTVDKSALIAAITAANKNKTEFTSGEAIETLTVVNTTTEGLQVSNTQKWVTQADVATYETAITVADGIVSSATATQSEVTAAIETLAIATTTFTNAKQWGQKQL